MSIQIPLNNGMVAIISEEDRSLAKHKWFAQKGGNIWYARRNVPQDSGPHRYRIKSLHRIIMGVDDRKICVDHINGNGLDCRRENLRIVSQAENTKNVSRSRSSNKHSPYLGVGLYHGKWRARIYHEGKLIEIGKYECIEDANQARRNYEKAVWGMSPRRL